MQLEMPNGITVSYLFRGAVSATLAIIVGLLSVIWFFGNRTLTQIDSSVAKLSDTIDAKSKATWEAIAQTNKAQQDFAKDVTRSMTDLTRSLADHQRDDDKFEADTKDRLRDLENRQQRGGSLH